MSKLKININYENFYKMILYARKAYELFKTEVSGMVPVFINPEQDAKGELRKELQNYYPQISIPKVVEQTCSSATTTMTKRGIADYMKDFASSVNNRDEIKAGNVIHCWWHSHHEMDAFWSATDKATIKEFAEKGPVFALVVNNRCDYKLLYAEPVTNALGITTIQETECELEFYHFKDFETEDIEKELKEVVSKETVSTKSSLNWFDRNKNNIPTIEDWSDDTLNLFDSNVKDLAVTDEVLMMEEESAHMQLLIDEEANKEAAILDAPAKPIKTIAKSKDNLLQGRFKSNEEYLSSLEDVIESQISNFHHNKINEHDAINEINKAVNEYNAHSDDVKLHNPPTVIDLYAIDDLLINKEGELNEPDYSKVSEHISSTGPLL